MRTVCAVGTREDTRKSYGGPGSCAWKCLSRHFQHIEVIMVNQVGRVGGEGMANRNIEIGYRG